jgi:hypothetical protein
VSAKVVIEQTDVGWNVEVTDADLVDVVTAGTSVAVSVHPDEDDHGKPLAVNLAPSVTTTVT